MHAALDINIPNYASAIVTTNEIVELISFLQVPHIEGGTRVGDRGDLTDFR